MGMYTENEEKFNNHPQQSVGQNAQSLLSAMNGFVQAVNVMDETVMIPSRLKDIPVHADDQANACTEKSLALVSTQKEGIAPSGDLYNFYTMLNAIKSELVRGQSEEETTDGSHADEQSRQTAAMFRHHLKGLFNVLRQLTESANHLTGRYQQELGDGINSTPRISSFTI